MTNIKTANFITVKCCDIAASAWAAQECYNILHMQEDSGFGNQQQLARGVTCAWQEECTNICNSS
jgi:hypothetical protein